MDLNVWGLELWQWIGLLAVLAGGLLLSGLLERLVLAIAFRAATLTKSSWDDQVVQASRGLARYLLLALLVVIGTRSLRFPPPAQWATDLVARSLLIVAVAWFLLRFTRIAALFIEQRVAAEEQDVGRVRGVKTQVTVLRRLLEVGIYLLAVSLLLVQFEAVRNIGVSLLASAGLAGLVIGLAAQKSISTLLAGIQLSLTQPVRIGDTVIVEGEWGWIEEITLTYVVVKVWDLRRLVIPMTYFLERPFQNWSKVSPELLGTIELHADYRTDVDAARAELKRILENEGSSLWDGKVQGIQVTGLTDRTMTIRALISAADSGKQWDLRCLVREKMVAWLRSHPDWLPTVRTDKALSLPEAGVVTRRAG